MARSQYIWVVIAHHDSQVIAATFTVKHELITWLGKQRKQRIPYLRVYRCPDSPCNDFECTRCVIKEFLIQELMKGS